MRELSSFNFIAIWIGSLWLLWLPGVLITSLIRLPRPNDWLLLISVQLGLGIVFWPILFLWTSIGNAFGLLPVWSASAARVAVICVGLFSIGLAIYRNRSLQIHVGKIQRQWLLLFFIIFVITVITRWQQIDGLVLPNWVDSVHHTVVTKLIVRLGALPNSYQPYLPDSDFAYHWGFHAVVAWLCWLLGRTDGFGIATTILDFGQVLNSLTPLMFYSGGRLLFQNRRAGFASAVLGSLVSWYPAYYVSWGRYPHLLGILLYAPLLIALFEILVCEKRRNCKKQQISWVIVAALILAGSVLIHIRTTFFALCLLGILAAYFLIKRRWSVWKWWGIAAFGAFLLTVPWLYHLVTNEKAGVLLLAQNKTTGIDMAQRSLFWVPGIPEIMMITSGGLSALSEASKLQLGLAILWLCCLLCAVFISFKKYHYRRYLIILKPILLLVGWCLAVFLLLNLQKIGFPAIGVVTIESAIITSFIPLVLIAGGLFAWATGYIFSVATLRLLTIMLLIVLGVIGASRMQTVVNPSTTIVTQADLNALHWIDDNLPANAKFASNAHVWLGNTYVGGDGGYWIPALTDRLSLLPPAIYTTVLSRSQAVEINQSLDFLSTLTSIDDPNIRSWLRAQGISYLYLVANKGQLLPESLFGKDYSELVYYSDSVYIYHLK